MTGPRSRARLQPHPIGSAALVVVALILVPGCGQDRLRAHPPVRRESVPSVHSPVQPVTRPPTDRLLPSVPGPMPIDWVPCDGSVQCGTLTVPLSYRDPTNRVIQVALRRHPADDSSARVGSLVINPGGPGEAGTLLLRRDLGVLTPAVRARFDVIEMDPRGVNATAGFTCDPPPDDPVDPIPTTADDEHALLRAVRAYADACARAAGPILAHMGTVDVARDLEQLRRAVGDQRLTFLGLSYGTLLGATYADLYPTHVRAMVLDGALDPSLSTADLSREQADGMQSQLDGFFAWCSGAPCPWHPGGDRPAAFAALAQRLRTAPLHVGDTSVGVAELYGATLSRMYSPTRWAGLASALAAAEQNDGGPILELTRAYFGARPGSTISADASTAVNCLDHPVDHGLDAFRTAAARAGATAPQFGPYLAWGGLQCAEWRVPPSRIPHAIHASGAAPIVVVGTTHDPATPYAWAESLADQLDQGILLTRRGTGHVAYLANGCVRSRLDAYLVDLVVPATDTACPG